MPSGGVSTERMSKLSATFFLPEVQCMKIYYFQDTETRNMGFCKQVAA